MFAGVFVASGGLTGLQDLMGAVNVGGWGLIAVALGLAFCCGFFLEPIAIVLILIPIVVPLIRTAGYDPVWFCVMFLVMLQTSYLTPPMAPSIFYLRGISPPEITLRDMYRGVVPFIVLQIIALALVASFQQLALWLPGVLLGGR